MSQVASDQRRWRQSRVISTIASSCFDVDPFAYLRDMLDCVSTHSASRIAALLPDAWTPGIWVVTIHDCLVTYPENAERVSQIMVEAFESVGIKPTIKVIAFNLNGQEARCGDPGSRVD